MGEISDLFNNIDLYIKNIKPTEIYCEGWLLRFIMIWFDIHRNIDSKIKLYDDATWFSEGSLLSYFKKNVD